ncbi:hypothetical protein [Paraburkholderia diazotrophica]|uniref:hypothetical protein n=1 Tax=Paraburkholderia diazotrophica TaxID=667676 RepID=UPI00316E4EFA
MTGLARLGVTVPQHAVSRVERRGVLTIPVFFGAVIGIERAVARKRAWSYIVPAASGRAGIALVAGAPVAFAQALLLLASIASLIGNAQILREQSALHLWVLMLGAGCWLFGTLVWLVTSDPLREGAVSVCITRALLDGNGLLRHLILLGD